MAPALHTFQIGGGAGLKAMELLNVTCADTVFDIVVTHARAPSQLIFHHVPGVAVWRQKTAI